MAEANSPPQRSRHRQAAEDRVRATLAQAGKVEVNVAPLMVLVGMALSARGNSLDLDDALMPLFADDLDEL